MTWIMTASGKRFDLTEDDLLEQIDINDIAHALANQCRFNGHCTDFYSVAQHSVLVGTMCPSPYRLAGLLHDAAEAYIGDIIEPVKTLAPCVRDLEHRIQDAINAQFNVDTYVDEVRLADRCVLAAEFQYLMRGRAPASLPVAPAGLRVDPWPAKVAKQEFLRVFDRFSENP